MSCSGGNLPFRSYSLSLIACRIFRADFWSILRKRAIWMDEIPLLGAVIKKRRRAVSSA
jgi:hypothetical protein